MADLNKELDLNVPAAPSLTLDAAPTLTLDPASLSDVSGLLDGVTGQSANDAITRDNAAQMIFNALFATTKNAVMLPGGNVGSETVAYYMDGPALAAMRHVVMGDPKRLFSFRLDVPSQKKMSDVCEAFLLTQLERGFRTLDFYKQMAL